MPSTKSALNQFDIPRPPRPHVDARTTGWLLAQRERIRELELDNSRQSGELEVSARVERGAQKACDRLEAEIRRSRQREASMARALGYAEAQRDQLQRQLAPPTPKLIAEPEFPGADSIGADSPNEVPVQARPVKSPKRSRFFGRRKRS
ncbi:MAG: hypothetical protein ACI9K5_004203 [Gammaproteobacteria bacterium]|jgi:hypothetical protein